MGERMGAKEPRSLYEQYSGKPARSRWRLAWWAKVLLLVPLALLIAGGVYVGSVLFAAQQAAQDVFVPSVRSTPVAGASATAPAIATGVPAGGTPAPVAAATAIPPTQPPEWTDPNRINIVLLGVDKRDDEETP